MVPDVVPGMVPALSPLIAHKSLNDAIRLARMVNQIAQLGHVRDAKGDANVRHDPRGREPFFS